MRFRFLKVQKVPKHKSFDYNPRYYDPKKEELERRIEIAKGKVGNSPEATKARIRHQLRNSRNNNPALRRQQVFKSNMLLLVIIVALVVIAFMILNVYLPRIVG